MSFLYEPAVLKKLGEALIKNAQQAQTHPDSPVLQLRDKLVRMLDSGFNEFTNPENMPQVVSNPGSQLTLTDLNDIGTFLSFLINNSISHLDHVLVTGDPESNTDERVEDSSIFGQPVYIHSESFVGYLNYLARSAEELKNKEFGDLVNNLMNAATKWANGHKLIPAKVYYENEFHENIHLGSVARSLFGSDEPGDVELKIGDLKEKTSFNKWIQKNFKNIEDVYKNLSNGLSALYEGFIKAYRQADSKFKEELNQEATKRVHNLAKTFNVQIGSQTNDQSSGDPSSEMSPTELSRVMHLIGQTLPFNENNVNVDKITKFFDNIIKLDPNYNSLKQQAISAFNKASAISGGRKLFPITVDVDHVLTSLNKEHKNRNGVFYYLNAIRTGLSYVYDAMDQFRDQQKSRLSKELSNKFNNQIGRTGTDYSTYKKNIFAIDDLKRRVNVLIQQSKMK